MPTDDEATAAKYLHTKLDAITTERGGGPAFITPKMARTTLGEMLEELRGSLELDGTLSKQTASHLKRAIADFGKLRAVSLTAKQADAYIKRRLDIGHKNASINRVTSLVKQAYKLAVSRGVFPATKVPAAFCFPACPKSSVAR